MFKMDVARKTTTNMGTYYIANIELRKDTIKVEPITNHINCKNTGKS